MLLILKVFSKVRKKVIRKFAMPNFFFLLLILRILVGCNVSYLIDGLSSYIIILFADNIGKIENATTV